MCVCVCVCLCVCVSVCVDLCVIPSVVVCEFMGKGNKGGASGGTFT